jgi:signal transduction histidine kinase
MRHLLIYILLLCFAAPLQAQSDVARIDSMNQRANSFRGTMPDSMIAIAQRALDEAKRIGYKKGQGDALRWMALGMNLTGQPGSEDLLDESYEIFTSIDDPAGLANTLNALATVTFYRGAYDLAGEKWHQALETYRQMGDSTGITNMWNNLGNLHRAMGQNEVALSYHQQALAYRETKTDTLNLAGSLNNVAVLMSILERYDEAIQYHERALVMNEAIGNRRSIGNSLMNLGSTHLRRGDATLALEYYQKAAEIRESMNDFRSLSGVYSGMADAYLALGEAQKAAEFATDAYDMAMRVNTPREANDASRFAYRAYRDAEDAATALKYLEIHKALSDSLLSIDRQRAIANLESVAELTRVQEELKALETEKFYSRIIFSIIIISLIGAVTALVYIRRSQQELRRHSALKDRMFSILSHDLRSPLTSLHSLIELLDMDVLTPDEWASLKSTLLRQFDVTDETLRDVLLWAKGQFEGEKPKQQSVNLNDAVASNVELVNLIASRKHITIRSDMDAGVMVTADRDHLMAIIRNLLTNAVKFTPSGKSITIRSESTNGNHILTIQDEGVGMSKERLDNLFKTSGQFTQGTAGESGSGLGLVFVYELVRRNHGAIHVESTPGAGSTFKVSLPRG